VTSRKQNSIECPIKDFNLGLLGVDTCKSLLNETIKIEMSSGRFTADGARRRLPGGTFAQLIREQVPHSVWAKIRHESRKSLVKFNSRRRHKLANAQQELLRKREHRGNLRFGKKLRQRFAQTNVGREALPACDLVTVGV